MLDQRSAKIRSDQLRSLQILLRTGGRLVVTLSHYSKHRGTEKLQELQDVGRRIRRWILDRVDEGQWLGGSGTKRGGMLTQKRKPGCLCVDLNFD